LLIAEDLARYRINPLQHNTPLRCPIRDLIRDVSAVLDNVLVELLVEFRLKVDKVQLLGVFVRKRRWRLPCLDYVLLYLRPVKVHASGGHLLRIRIANTPKVFIETGNGRVKHGTSLEHVWWLSVAMEGDRG